MTDFEPLSREELDEIRAERAELERERDEAWKALDDELVEGFPFEHTTLGTQLAVAREALEFYASEDNYDSDGPDYDSTAQADYGERARAALDRLNEGKP